MVWNMIREDGLLKYPSTPHLEGSRLQPGDSKDTQLAYRELIGKYIVAEEKMDGANSGVSFSLDVQLRLQSRGHFLTGGSRERYFNMLKSWAAAHEEALFDALTDRYIMFGEWMYAKHSMFYDALPHYFLEFDLFDKKEEIFLSSKRRHELLKDYPIVSVPVLYAGVAPEKASDITRLIGYSLGRTDGWRTALEATAQNRKLDVERVVSQTDSEDRTEGLYIKVEDDERVLARYKFVRSSFTQTIMDGEEHWQDRPIVPNGLKEGVDIFAPTIDKSWPAFRPMPLIKGLRR